MEKRNTTLIVALILFFLPAISAAIETAPKITDREIVERLTRLEERLTRVEEGQKAILREIDKRFEAMDKRFESMDKRFDAIDRKIDLLAGIFTAIVVSVIGFAIWDRRTMIRPFETKVKSIEEEISETHGRQKGLIEAFQILGRRDEQVAEVLRRFHLM
jgi:predicted PurR-regulated permease PerM